VGFEPACPDRRRRPRRRGLLLLPQLIESRDGGRVSGGRLPSTRPTNVFQQNRTRMRIRAIKMSVKNNAAAIKRTRAKSHVGNAGGPKANRAERVNWRYSSLTCFAQRNRQLHTRLPALGRATRSWAINVWSDWRYRTRRCTAPSPPCSTVRLPDPVKHVDEIRARPGRIRKTARGTSRGATCFHSQTANGSSEGPSTEPGDLEGKFKRTQSVVT